MREIRAKKKATVADYKQEMLLRVGTEQFKTLLKKGLQIPVALL